MGEREHIYQIGIQVEGLGEMATAEVVHRAAIHQEVPHTPLHTHTHTITPVPTGRLGTSVLVSVMLESSTSCKLMGRQRAWETLEARDAPLRLLPNIRLW